MTLRIAPIVEGHGEVQAVPVLLRRLAHAAGRFDVDILSPLRTARSRLSNPHEFDRAVEFSARKAGPKGAILVILDADDDAACRKGPELLARAGEGRHDLHVSVVLAVREYESWFLGSIHSLRGHRGIRSDAEFSEDPEDVRGAKERLESLMDSGRVYSPTLDQPAMTALLDLSEDRRRCPSFDKLCRECDRLLAPAASA